MRDGGRIFEVGQRVCVKAEVINGYLQPYRGWFEARRVGTVIGRVPSMHAGDIAMVEFDTKRKPKAASDYRVQIRDSDLELAKERT